MMVGSLFKRLEPVLCGCCACAAVVLCALAGSTSSSATDPQSPPGRSFAQPAVGPAAGQNGSTGLALAEAKPDVKTLPPAPVTAAPATAAPVTKEQPAWPKTLPEAKADQSPPPDVFTADEINTAKARCMALLNGLDVVVIDEQPIKAGNCGTPAPVQLISLGRNPQVAISPPVIMTCEMVAALHKWVTGDVQPLAKKHLGSAVVGIETMSSYSCRNAYGRKKTNLSEHGRANALDIRSFVTANAKEANLLADWGPTAREIKAQIAAAQAAAKLAAEKKAAAEKLAAEKAAAAKQQAASKSDKPAEGTVGNTPAVGTLIEGVPGLAERLPGAGTSKGSQNGFSLTRPSPLGGPKQPSEPSAKAPSVSQPNVRVPTMPAPPAVLKPEQPTDGVSQTKKAQFLREAHTAACRIFGTTLGPETNLAHKNHFHVDMAERTRSNYCE